MLASSGVSSRNVLQARGHARSLPLLTRKPASARPVNNNLRLSLIAPQALGSNSTEEAPSQAAQPASQDAQPEQPTGELTLQVRKTRLLKVLG
jgi:hypothetical protein